MIDYIKIDFKKVSFDELPDEVKSSYFGNNDGRFDANSIGFISCEYSVKGEEWLLPDEYFDTRFEKLQLKDRFESIAIRINKTIRESMCNEH